MITNTACTIYNELEDGAFKRTVIPACFWRNVKAHEVKRYGAENASSITVMIFSDQLCDYVSPADFTETGWTVDGEKECYICKGEVNITPDNISEVYNNVRECYKICSSTENLYGAVNLQHIRIEGN